MGTWEEEVLVEALSQRARRAGAAYAGPGSGNDIGRGERPPIAFTGGLPDPVLLPSAALTEATAAVLADDANGALQYGGAQGWEGLRLWMASHWSAVDGLDLTPEHYCFTNGSAGALANVCETFLDADSIVGVEAPSFPGSIRTIRSISPHIESIPVDQEGLDVDALESRLDELHAAGRSMRLLYTIPSFQNPTGSTLSVARRRQLVEVCRRRRVLIVEDDAYGQLSFGEAPPPSLYALAGGDGVIKLGTFSKTIAPGLRAGWAQASPGVVAALVATRSDMGTSPLVLRLVARLTASGFFDEHVERVRHVYARKCSTMLDELDAACTGLAEWNRPTGGFFIWVKVADFVDPSALVETARDEGVSFVGGRIFFAEQTAAEGPRPSWGPADFPYFRLAFSYVAEDQIAEGVQRLGRAMKAAVRA